MRIKLSEIQIIPVSPRNGLLAFVSFILNNSFYIGDVALYSLLNGDGYRLVFPIRTLPNGKEIQCFHPINRESGEAIEEQVFESFSKLREKAIATREGRNNKH